MLRHSSAIALLALAVCPQFSTPVTAENPPRYEVRKEHDPDGTGRFYMGREIAQIMGHEGADWLERGERVQEERPELVISALRIDRGQSVADVGCGTGYYTRRLATAVGTAGKVYAVDVQQEMLDLLAKKLAASGLTNVVPVLGGSADPKLPADSIDLALMVDVYHELEFPYEMVQEICKTLKPGGRLVLVEFRGEDSKVPIKRVHKMTEAQVRKELAVQPLVWRETLSALPWQHILVFEKGKTPR